MTAVLGTEMCSSLTVLISLNNIQCDGGFFFGSAWSWGVFCLLGFSLHFIPYSIKCLGATVVIWHYMDKTELSWASVVAQWLALLPHSKKVLASKTPAGMVLSSLAEITTNCCITVCLLWNQLTENLHHFYMLNSFSF